MNTRLRYAPSPTGLQHLGGIRTALFCFLLAKSANGTFILRIEDTDRTRLHPDAIDDLYDVLRWLNITWDEGPDKGGDYGPYIQSDRLDIYHTHVQTLLKRGVAYKSEEERVQEGKSVKGTVIRLKIPTEGSITMTDGIVGDLTFQYDAIPSNPVLIKSDGFPTYHFASVVDDHLMHISHVIRSQEWLSSLPIHWHMYEAFGWKLPQFFHLPLIVGSDGKKLSKRYGSMAASSFRSEGVLPNAIWNFLSLLGWSYDDTSNFFSPEKLLEVFSFQGLNKSQAMYDELKLFSLNGEHIRTLNITEFIEYCEKALGIVLEKGSVLRLRLESIAVELQARCNRFSDVAYHWEYIGYSIADDGGKRFSGLSVCDGLEADILTAMIHIIKEHSELFAGSYENSVTFDEMNHDSQEKSDAIVNLMKAAANELQTKPKTFFMCVQETITGRKKSLPVAHVMIALKKEETIQRLRNRMNNETII